MRHRLPPFTIDSELLKRLESLLPAFAGSPSVPRSPAGLALPSRAELLRRAIERGLPSLEAELAGGATRK